MRNTAFGWFERSSIVGATVLASACADGAPVAPAGVATPGAAAATVVSRGNRLPELPAGCEKLVAPEGSTLVLRALGIGVQIYRWDGASWRFVAPSATLFADAGAHGQVATHFGGPTWQSNSGGTVVGTVAERCTPDPASIPWLSLTGDAHGPGIFQKVTFIQRLNTVGGNAPSTPGSTVGEEAPVPYTADYLFYQAP
jgi:hypothetical protein